MRTTLVFREETWRELTAALDEPRESGGFILAGLARGADDLTFLARDLRLFANDQYLKRTTTRFSIGSRAIVAALAAAAADKAVPIFVHTHPKGKPEPSPHDRRVDRQLREAALVRSRQPYYVSLIVGGTKKRPRFTGWIYGQDGEVAQLARIRVVGDRLQLLTADDGAKRSFNSAAFDRQVRAFGRDAQKVIGELKVGVVGAGGTGSAVFEQLVRLGVGEIVIVDGDRITDSNLTRIHEASHAEIKELKVEVMKEAAARIGLKTLVTAIVGKVSVKAITRQMKHCDLIFGCTDDHTGRQTLSKLAAWYLIPVIDMGFLISTNEKTKKIRGLFGRVTTVFPGAACLVCRDYSTPAGLHAEALPPEERAARAREGYAQGLGDPDPSVAAFTTMVASFAVSEMLDRLIDYSSLAVRPTELLIRLHDRKLSTNSKPPRGAHWCGRRANWGRGDATSFLGSTP